MALPASLPWSRLDSWRCLHCFLQEQAVERSLVGSAVQLCLSGLDAKLSAMGGLNIFSPNRTGEKLRKEAWEKGLC